MTIPASQTCLETEIKMPDPDAEMRATCLGTRDAYVICSTVGLHHSHCRCLSACTFIHSHSFANSLLVKLTINEWIKYTCNFSQHCLNAV